MKSILFKLFRFLAQFLCYFAEIFVKICEWPSFKILSLFQKSEYLRQGQCQMTGQCCRLIGMEFPLSWHRRPRLLALIRKWHHLRYNFSYLGTSGNMLVYECRYLTPDNTCGIQRFKPSLCRDFPKTPLLGLTKLHKGCGFYFVKREESEFEKVLSQVQKRG